MDKEWVTRSLFERQPCRALHPNADKDVRTLSGGEFVRKIGNRGETPMRAKNPRKFRNGRQKDGFRYPDRMFQKLSPALKIRSAENSAGFFV